MIIHRRTKKGVKYLVRVRDPHGRWYQGKTFTRKADAEHYERHLLSLRVEGTWAEPAQVRQMTLPEYWEQFARERRSHVSGGWKKSQDQMARDYILPVLGSRKLQDVRPRDIGDALNLAFAKGLQPQSVQHVYNLLHKLFEDAIEYYEYLGRNPVLKRDKPRARRTERRFLTPRESWKLLEASKNDFLGPAIWLGLLSGLRPSEIQALRWRNVHLHRRYLVICEAYKRRIRKIEPYPKQEDWGKAPLPEALVNYLASRQVNAKSEYVAPGLRGGMLKYEILLFGLKRLCRENGIKEVSPHELRHSCTELYIDAGASAEDIRRLLNQSSLSVTRTYIHRTDERLSGIAARVAPMPNLPVGGPPKGRTPLRLVQ